MRGQGAPATVTGASGVPTPVVATVRPAAGTDLSALLAPLVAAGAHVLTEVPWPGVRDHRLPAVVVAPSGVWLVEHRGWKGVSIRDGRVFRARQEVTGELRELVQLAGRLTTDLMRLGLVPGEVHAVFALTGRGGRAGRVAGVEVVGERDLSTVVATPGRRLADLAVAALFARIREIVGPDVPEVVAPTVLAPDDPAAKLRDAPLQAQWATVLDPAQATAAWRSCAGPLRVRGLPGSGTSTVAVHRAVHLARTWDGLVALVVPAAPLAAELWDRLVLVGPDVAERVVVARPAELARRVLAQSGLLLRDEPSALAAAWSAAELHAGVLTSGADGQAGDGRVRAEVMHVVRGRGLSDPASYDAARPELPPQLRHEVWALSQAYARELVRRNVPDDHDVLRIATAALSAGSIDDPGFAAVVVDDAQDLTLGALRFVRALAGDGEDSLMVIDDGLPGLHPGAASLPEAGIEVGDRLVNLEISRRLSVQSWAYVVQLLTPDGARDVGGLAARPRVRGGLHVGVEPEYVRSAIARLRREKLVARACELLHAPGVCPAGVAVLCLGREPEPALLTDLAQAGLVVTDLADPDPDAVHVGTVRESRGLQFDHVLVADAPHRMFVDEPREGWDRVLTRRLLALAVTRARASVWIGGV